jgi:hypothetical protein
MGDFELASISWEEAKDASPPLDARSATSRRVSWGAGGALPMLLFNAIRLP